MLRTLRTNDVGPAAELRLDPLAPRINLITGDNGLGKSFLLDLAWWVLTRTMGKPAIVANSPTAVVEANLDGSGRFTARLTPRHDNWKWPPHKPDGRHGLVLYARMDGSFWLWDPLRNLGAETLPSGQQVAAPYAFHFSTWSVMDGLWRGARREDGDRDQLLCPGLIHDWVLWQKSDDPAFALLERLLERLSPPGEEPLRAGESTYVGRQDGRLIPTVRMPYGQSVPLTHAPAGVLRMAKLAYLLTWALSSHRRLSAQTPDLLAQEVTLIIDEPETHLHPAWQRKVLPSLLEALKAEVTWTPSIQMFIATHSPLVLASMEPTFDPEQDALWKLDLVNGKVQVERDDWHRRGDATAWLRSDVFDLREARSVEAERAIREASDLSKAHTVTAEQVEAVDRAFQASLSDIDPLWSTWTQIKRGLEVRG
jgi:hypothetical protein